MKIHTLRQNFIIGNKKRIPQASRKKTQVSYKGSDIRVALDFSVVTLKTRRHKAMHLKLRKSISELEVYIFPN